MTQAQALDILKTGANVFLTGEPGAGKSYTINQYVAYLRGCGIEPAITASTGIAATHIGGYTIHAWSGIGVHKSLTAFDLDRISTTEYLVKRVGRPSVLIIDEVSMLDANTVSMVDAVCKEIRRSDRPFGGLQVIFVGDFFQLPPVSAGGDRSRFAFESPVWSELSPIVCYLSEQHRQDDEDFLNVLAAIRRAEFDEDHAEHLRERMGKGFPKDATKLYTHNVDVDRVNTLELVKLPGSTYTFSMFSEGTPGLLGSLKKGCLSPEELALKKGAVVMFTKNNPAAGYVNGTLGVIEDFDKDSGHPMVRARDGRLLTATPAEWRVEENGKVKAKILQVPLRLAWALTVHKSQGVSLDCAVMDLSNSFEYGQGYVALSRVRRLAGLYLLGCNQRALEVHPHILEKDTRFRENSRAAEAGFGTMTKADLATLHDQFISACGGAKPDPNKKKAAPKEKEKKSKAATGRLAAIREKYPNAYRSWSEGDDAKLRDLFVNDTPITEISKQFGRQRGSIHARLVKLGLIEE